MTEPCSPEPCSPEPWKVFTRVVNYYDLPRFTNLNCNWNYQLLYWIILQMVIIMMWLNWIFEHHSISFPSLDNAWYFSAAVRNVTEKIRPKRHPPVAWCRLCIPWNNWLVVTGTWLLFSHKLGMSSSQLMNWYLSGGWLNHQADRCPHCIKICPKSGTQYSLILLAYVY